jgi:hypothetical protein
VSDHPHPNPHRPRLARAAWAVQDAHDVLQLALTAADAGRIPLDPAAYAAVAGGLNLCCWLLGHPSSVFADVLVELESDMRAAGLFIVDTGRPPPGAR